MSYKVKLEIFEGPLDLLLFLVKQNHLEIDAIPIATITDQYLKYLEIIQALDLEIAGEFLVVAATLMQIKSRMLLPREEAPTEEEEPDPTQELIQRLKEYERFKQAAEMLSGMEKGRLETFSRPSTSHPVAPEADDEEELVEASLFDLLTAFSQFMSGSELQKLVHEIIQDEHTVEQKIELLRSMVREQGQVSLSGLLKSARTKMEVVATFLALLELIRLKELLVRQNRLFSEIVVVRRADSVAPITGGEND